MNQLNYPDNNRENIKGFAPHLFLSKTVDINVYKLFVIVKSGVNYELKLRSFKYDSLMSIIKFDFVNVGTIGTVYDKVCFLLSPPNFNPNTHTVVVTTEKDSVVYKTIISYSNADDNIVPVDCEIAFGSPHAYLTVNSQSSPLPYKYEPFVIIPVNNLEIIENGDANPELKNLAGSSNPEDAYDCIGKTVLTSGNGGEDYITELKINKCSYELDKDDGIFQVSIDELPRVNGTIRKTKIKNANADEKPTKK